MPWVGAVAVEGAAAVGGAAAFGVGAPALGVCASAFVDRTARPNATATPKSENILRRETISDSILSIIFDLLDFDDNTMLHDDPVFGVGARYLCQVAS
jgi:hypothetical protein